MYKKCIGVIIEDVENKEKFNYLVDSIKKITPNVKIESIPNILKDVFIEIDNECFNIKFTSSIKDATDNMYYIILTQEEFLKDIRKKLNPVEGKIVLRYIFDLEKNLLYKNQDNKMLINDTFKTYNGFYNTKS